MAVDTRNERGAAISFGAPHRPILPDPDAAAEGQDDRQQVGYIWPGLLVGGAVPGQPTVKRWAFVPHLGGANRLFQPSVIRS